MAATGPAAARVAATAVIAVPLVTTSVPIAIPVAITLDVAVSTSVALAAAVPVTSVSSVHMAAFIGEGWADQMMGGIDRGEGGACNAQGYEP